jgi:hypothetical protein
MKMIRHISMLLRLCRELILMRGLVVSDGDGPKFGCLVKDLFSLKPPAIREFSVRYSICPLFEYASDSIWMLGKNNFDTFVPAGCFRSAGTDVATTFCSQRKPSSFWQ